MAAGMAQPILGGRHGIGPALNLELAMQQGIQGAMADLTIANTVSDLIQGDVREHLPLERIPLKGDVLGLGTTTSIDNGELSFLREGNQGFSDLAVHRPRRQHRQTDAGRRQRAFPLCLLHRGCDSPASTDRSQSPR